MKSIKSPIRYPGAKSSSNKIIISEFIPHTSYVEVFGGSAAIFFKKEKVEHNWINDIDPNIINLFTVIRDKLDELKRMFQVGVDKQVYNILTEEEKTSDIIPFHKTVFQFIRNEYKPETDIEKAFRYYYLNRICFNGAMLYPNYSRQQASKMEKDLNKYFGDLNTASLKLKGVKLTNLDFEEVVDNCEDGSMVFLDPPYIKTEEQPRIDELYKFAFNYEDHYRLLDVVKRNSHRLNIFITYNNVDEIKDMYSWCQRVEPKYWEYFKYTLNKEKRLKAKLNGGEELFIINYLKQSELQTRSLF